MELPKNIVQIGKPDKVHKIFIEDYVVSYIKQLNRNCDGRTIGVALYGRFCEENGCKYYFLYGAAKVNGLEHRGAYLSQKDKEEVAETGKKYFEEYEFLAWCCAKGEPLEKLFVKAQGKGVEVEGYACFYEKNESMLNYMMLPEQEIRETNEEETVMQSKIRKEEEKNYGDAARKIRGDWRASDYMRLNMEETTPAGVQQKERTSVVPKKEMLVKNIALKKTEYMKLAAVAVFLVLCVVGITTLNDYGKLEDLQVVANQVIANMTEQKLPDADNQNVVSGGDLQGTTISGGTVDKTPALPTTEPSDVSISTPLWNDASGNETVTSGEVSAGSGTVTSGELSTGSGTVMSEEVTEGNETVMTPEEPVISQSVVTPPTPYTIMKGDTLNSICMSRYGSLARVQEICELNDISNADNIQIGQTILLP